MQTQTLQQLRDNVRRRADAEGRSALDRHSEDSVDEAIELGRAAFFRILTMHGGEDRVLTTQTINTVVNTTTYALAADFQQLISVDLTSQGRNYWLQPFQHEERGALSDPSLSYSGDPRWYRLTAETIELLPTPKSVLVVTLRYAKAPAELTGPSDVWDTIARLDEFAVYYAARILCEKDRAWDVVDRYGARIAELTGDIVTFARSRDKAGPPRMRDVYAARSRRSRWA